MRSGWSGQEWSALSTGVNVVYRVLKTHWDPIAQIAFKGLGHTWLHSFRFMQVNVSWATPKGSPTQVPSNKSATTGNGNSLYVLFVISSSSSLIFRQTRHGKCMVASRWCKTTTHVVVANGNVVQYVFICIEPRNEIWTQVVTQDTSRGAF